MSYCFMAFKKLKTGGALSESMKHNFRQEEVLNADPNKSHLNKELIKLQSEDYLTAVKEAIGKSPVYQREKVRKNAVLAMEFMLTYTGKTNPELFDQEKWEKANVEWLNNKFGAENVVSAICHYDERTPHIHAIVVPMKNGRLNARGFTDGKGACSAMQTEYSKLMSQFGLERGLQFSGAKHTDIQKFYAAIEKAIERQLPPAKEGETIEEYRERAGEIVRELGLKHIDEINKEQRKTQAVKASLAKARSDLKDAQAELSVYKGERDIKMRKASRLDELYAGLKNGYLPQESREAFEQTIKIIVGDERDRKLQEGMTVDQKAAFMDDLLDGLKNSDMPPEEREAFNREMRDIVEWEREYEKESPRDIDEEENLR